MLNIRNFCIIAHIDHGKSTLADRMLELTATVSSRQMRSQFLDQMDIERERGITIKLQPVRMTWNAELGMRNPGEKNNSTFNISHSTFILNLIDTPGHVDFTYEVSRSLAAVEGAILLVDATQGIQAQTLANLYKAMDLDLTIIPVINKIDLPAARPDEIKEDIVSLLGVEKNDILAVSAKTGQGVTDLLRAVVERIPPPTSDTSDLRALIFDSQFSDYRGVIAYVRVVDGAIKKGDQILFMATKEQATVLEVGIFSPARQQRDQLTQGEIGYVITGIKDIKAVRVGDTITKYGIENAESGITPLAGYKEIQPMVFAGIFPMDGGDASELRDALEKLKLNDASLSIEPEHSPALGYGFRCGFLGLLHLDVTIERLKREYNLGELIITTPSVAYHVFATNGQMMTAKSPLEFPDPSRIDHIEEPYVTMSLITPTDAIGGLMQVVQRYRGIYKNTEYLHGERAHLHYEMPLSSILVDFYDSIKSVSAGYASMSYELVGYREASVERMDILVAEEMVEPLSIIVYSDAAYEVGRSMTERLKESLPKQMFEVKIQAVIGGKVIASERLSAMKKDVLAKMSGGDYTRKRKLLEKQKKGKKKMMAAGRVQIPQETYLSLLKR